jgi:uncharacterized protein (TIGR00645 family)
MGEVKRFGAAMLQLERIVESIIFHSRWAMAPFYLGLVGALVLLFIHFLVELVELARHIMSATEADIILGVLGLIDLTFTGNLVLIVIFSGYENFVSRIETTDRDRPDWMTKVDFGGLKQKLMTSIVAISAVQVLKAFMNVDKYDSTRLGWLVGIHVLFLGSLLAVVIADRIGDGTKHSSEKAPEGGH